MMLLHFCGSQAAIYGMITDMYFLKKITYEREEDL